jgi:hypothetical protein
LECSGDALMLQFMLSYVTTYRSTKMIITCKSLILALTDLPKRNDSRNGSAQTSLDNTSQSIPMCDS